MKLLLEIALYFSQFCVVLAMLLCMLRLLKGPTAQDRVLALDTLWICAMLFALFLINLIKFTSVSNRLYYRWFDYKCNNCIN